MQKTGGVIAIIAGAVVVGTTFITLLIGGGIDWEVLSFVENIGWGGVFFSFLVIIFGIMSLAAKDKKIGVFLILSAILAAIWGGLFVTIIMVFAVIGGIIATMEIKKREENRAG